MTGVFEGIRQRHITRKGRPVTLRRGNQTASVLAFFSVWAPDQVDGTSLKQDDMRVDLLADLGNIDLPPRNPDMIVAGDVAYTVLWANPVYEAEVLIGWTMAARGV